MILRAYQQRCLDQLYDWWMRNPGEQEIPLVVMPTGSGKSVVIAELVRLLFAHWPEDHPRTVVLVPSKELAEQNAEKLVALLPEHISIGYYSASLGARNPNADVIVATIGTIWKDANRLGNIKMVLIDEAHLTNPDGAEAGRYRKFIAALARVCSFRVVGFTATPFRGNGIWLTDGEAPLFSGVATTVTMRELLEANYLAPLVRPIDVIATRIDTAGISTTSGDYKLDDLADRVENYLPAAARETVTLAAERRKWIAFCATVANAERFVALLDTQGITATVVCGDTPKQERQDTIAAFRAGRIRCLVTVLALATGFDVPDVDCIVWLRPTLSPVLYVQGIGRGMRIAAGKVDCLWLDFSDTTERMGPVDAITGRQKKRGNAKQEAPYAICPECGTRVRPASLIECPDCGATLRDEEAEARARAASNAAVLSHQIAARIQEYEITRVSYAAHQKIGKPDSLRVDYFAGLRRVASEWVCLDHSGFARAKAEIWWRRRAPREFLPGGVAQALEWIETGYRLIEPASIAVNETGKYPEIVGYHWERKNEPSGISGPSELLPAGA